MTIFLRICFTVLLVTFSLLSPSMAEQDQNIKFEIDSLMSCLNSKCDWSVGVAKIVAFGDQAVPALIEEVQKTDGDWKKRPLIASLCRIGSDRARDFLRDFLNKRNQQETMSVAMLIQEYPIKNEMEIRDTLINLLFYPNVLWNWEVSERSKAMIVRNPQWIGFIIKRLGDAKPDSAPVSVYTVLENITGYDLWACFEVKGECLRDEFWRQWWKRNQNKNQIEWLLEPLRSENAWRREQACKTLFNVSHPRVKDYFLKLIDDPEQKVRYWAVYGLKRLEGFKDDYLFEDYIKNEQKDITELKQKF